MAGKGRVIRAVKQGFGLSSARVRLCRLVGQLLR